MMEAVRAAQEETARRLIDRDTCAFVGFHRPRVVHPTRGLVLYEPFGFQADLLRALDAGGPVVVNKARQIGISTTVMVQKARRLLEDHRRILVVSRKEDKAKELLEIAAEAIRTCDPPFPVETDIRTLEIRAANGSRISVETAAPNTGRGFSGSDIVLDEMVYLPHADRIYRSLRPIVSRNGNIVCVSTPDMEGDRFSEIWGAAQRPDSDWAAFEWDWHVYPEYDDEWAKRERKEYTQAEWASEYLCQFGSSASAVFRREVVDAAVALGAVAEARSEAHTIGGDFAGAGRDETVFVALDTSDEPWVVADVEAHATEPAPELQGNLEHMVERYDATPWVDETGLGWGLRGNLACDSIGVVFTGGAGEPKRDGDTWRVPRDKLISNCVLAVEQGRVAIPERFGSLVLGLRSYRWEKRKGTNADYVDALALAVWGAEHTSEVELFFI